MFGKKQESWLIVGLGNPGKQYERTRHNCGFRAIDVLAQKLGCKVDKSKFQGLYGQANYNGTKLLLLKPLTYMNLSGRSVLQLSAWFHVPPQQIIVMFDDISLEPGRLRIRADGSAGGHNGIKSAAGPSPGSRSVWAARPIRSRTWRIMCCPPSLHWKKRHW